MAGQPILVVAPEPFLEDRGTPIAVYQLLGALGRLGYSVDLLTYPVGREIRLPGVRVFRVPNRFRIRTVPIGFSLRKLVLDVELTIALHRRLRAQRYRCIHAVEEAAFPALLLGRRAGIPVIYDMQSSLPEQLAQRRLFRIPVVRMALDACERWLLRGVSAVVSSTGLAARVRAAAPRAHVREWVYASEPCKVERGQAERLRAELCVPEHARLVVYAGTFEDYQGLPALLSAIPAVCRSVPDAVFVCVGSRPDERSAVERKAAELNLNGRLRLLPRQPRERLPALLAMADVLVSPRAYGQNLPLKIFDYLAAGRPIVATDIPAHRSILTPERARLVPSSPEGLASGIRDVLLDPALAERLAGAARAYAQRYLGQDVFVRSVQELYDHVCGRETKSACAS
ncbi:MAG TPA: glycosyltransferase [Longimicrobiales bacterium]